MLVAKNIHFCIQNRPIVDNADLNLEPGQMTALIGPNGAGKSTLLKILSGDIACQHGQIFYNGMAIKYLSSQELARVRAVMPQHSQLSFPFKAVEVVGLGLLSLSVRNPQKIVKEVMEETQTWHLKDKLYAQLSGGEKQRVQLSRVLAQIWADADTPRYLLLDEPTSSLDIAHQHQVLHIASKLKKNNIGVLAVLHDLNMAAAYADQIVMLKNGNIFQSGPAAQVMTSENLFHVFEHPIEVHQSISYHGTYIQSLPINRKNVSIKIA
jgi:iron complex transport system ATP-binding protein